MLVDVWRTVTSVGEYRQKGHKKGLLGNVPFHDQGAGDMGVFSWRKFSHCTTMVCALFCTGASVSLLGGFTIYCLIPKINQALHARLS